MYKKPEVESLFASYNTSMPEGKRLEIPKILEALTASGAGVEAVAKEMTFEDIADCGVPMPIARAIARIWRAEAAPVASPSTPGKKGVQFGEFELSGAAELALAIGQVSGLGDSVLLANYDPMGRDDIVRELDARARGKKFIVFTDKASLAIDVGMSLGFLRLIKQSVDVGDFTTIEGRTVELFRSGVLPDRALDICPIHGNHLINGFCGQCHQSWSEVDESMRQLAFLQVKEVWEGNVPTHDDPRIALMFAALRAGENDPYWSDAKLFLDKYKSTGQVIVLVKPITTVPMRQPEAPRRK